MINPQSIQTISDLRFKTKDVLKKAIKAPVFLFHRSHPQGVLLSYEKYIELMSQLEDYYLSIRAEEWENEDKKRINWILPEEIKKSIM